MRPLPKRLEPDESWETWFSAVSAISVGEEEAFLLARVRLSIDKVVKPRKREKVPAFGACRERERPRACPTTGAPPHLAPSWSALHGI
jgi:hypothetical protein